MAGEETQVAWEETQAAGEENHKRQGRKITRGRGGNTGVFAIRRFGNQVFWQLGVLAVRRSGD